MYTYSLVSYIEALRCCPVIQQNRNPLLFHKRDAWAFAKSCNTESMIASKSNFQSVLSFNSRKELTHHLCPASVSLPGQVRFVVFTLFSYPTCYLHLSHHWKLNSSGTGRVFSLPPFLFIRKFSHCFEVFSPAQTDSSFRSVPLTHTLYRKGLQNYWCTRYELWLPISNVFSAWFRLYEDWRY